MRRAKIKCNSHSSGQKILIIIIIQWEDYLLHKRITNCKDMQKVWEKAKEVKNGIHLPQCPVTLDNEEFPSPEEKKNLKRDLLLPF